MAGRLTVHRASLALSTTLAVAIVVGCGSAASPTTQVSSVPSALASAAPTPMPVASAAPSTPAATNVPSSATPAATPLGSAGPLIPGVATVTLITAQSGNGTRPQLTWQPVDGAATYRLTVFATDGRPYWSWEGADASVYFGGGAQPLPDDAPGPLLGAGMTWVVFAADADGNPIAASAITPIAP